MGVFAIIGRLAVCVVIIVLVWGASWQWYFSPEMPGSVSAYFVLIAFAASAFLAFFRKPEAIKGVK